MDVLLTEQASILNIFEHEEIILLLIHEKYEKLVSFLILLGMHERQVVEME